MPDNWEEIIERLARPRPLSPKLSDGDFRQFKRADTLASKEKPVTTLVVPLLDGNIICHYGARPEQLSHQIREELSHYIIPSTQDDLLMPNFFLEAKGPDELHVVATRQACYDGALGARGMHFLQSYQQEGPTYDNNTYTLTSIYHGGALKIYATHVTTSEGPDSRPEYITTQVNTWGMTGNPETFRQGISAYRNARDWAKEKRDEFIRAANERLSEAHSQHSSITQHQSASDLTPNLDDSDASTESDEYQDAQQWKFAALIEHGEEEPQGKTKKPRIHASESPLMQLVTWPATQLVIGLPNRAFLSVSTNLLQIALEV
ncbi:hypothetical protein AJ80_01134 [Polytolypa hystricis UAMH7299]|uniref:Uncharacterized protein n=1 Tax=Polytolypa hystricis (strain UAMH7299) TaxID=1447883 RepID=A0A2B7Z2X1_POLH7|nr:hypothetical protein AJ80_01134 [Polytolypa hystricis UAMH7299]